MKRLAFFIFLIILGVNVEAMEDATLKNIKVNNKPCECIEYRCEVEIDSDSVTITYDKSSQYATVDRVSGVSIYLSSEVTNISITVTSGDKANNNIYEFVVTKHIKSSDYTLSKLLVNNKEIVLIPDVFVYSAQVPFDEEEIIVTPTLNDSKAIITSSLTYEFPLENSSKMIDFEVKAENGDKKSYRIVMTRSKRPNTTLKSLQINHGTLEFNEKVFAYSFEVEYSVTDIIIEAIPNDSNALVKINKKSLEVGENIITIEVINETAMDTYTIEVIRGPNLDKSLANLEVLKIKEVNDLDFDPNILEYDLKFSDIPESLTIEAHSKNDNGKINIVGNEDLDNNSVIKIEVKLDENDITRTYTLNVVKISQNFMSKKLIIISITCLLMVMITLFFLEFKAKKNKRNIFKEEIEII